MARIYNALQPRETRNDIYSNSIMKTVSRTNNPENAEAEIFAKWLRMHGYYSTHIANESGLPKKIAMFSMIRKKRMGLSQ